MKKIVVLLLVVGLVACGDEDEVKSVALGQEFSLNEGDAAVISDLDIRLDVNGLSDSRCPEGVQCIWEGEAKVLFSFEVAGGQVVQDSLSTHNRLSTTINGYTVKLLDVTPYPELDNSRVEKTSN